MDKVRLKELALDEFKKKVPQDIAADANKTQEFLQRNIDFKVLDELVAEYCVMNPAEFAELNPFNLSPEKAAEIKQNIGAAIEDGTINRLRYEQIVNNAGLAYIKEQAAKLTGEIDMALKNRQQVS